MPQNPRRASLCRRMASRRWLRVRRRGEEGLAPGAAMLAAQTRSAAQASSNVFRRGFCRLANTGNAVSRQRLDTRGAVREPPPKGFNASPTWGNLRWNAGHYRRVPQTQYSFSRGFKFPNEPTLASEMATRY